MKIVIGIILVFIVVVGGSWLLVDWAFTADMKNAEKTCAALGAEPNYTYRTNYICVTPDGRVVG